MNNREQFIVANETSALREQLSAERASQQMCVGAAGIGDFSELCGWIDDVKQKLAVEKAARLKAESACGEMRRLLELLKTGPVFRDEVDHALALLDKEEK